MLSRFGNVTAMERDDYAREHIPSDVEAEILKGWLPDGLSSINNKKFDLICLFDVLEHIKEDVQSLVILKDYLKPGAKLLLTAPAYPWMFSTHDANLGHYRRYTRRELLLKCKNTGYKIRYAGYMNMFLLPFMILIRFIDKIIYAAKSTGNAIPPYWLNTLLYHLFAVESCWIPYIQTPMGGSVVILAEK